MAQICSLLTLASIALYVPTSRALTSQVLSSFVYTRYGDRTPLYSPELSVLTPYGAQQMYTAGSHIRNRYLSTTSSSATDSTTIRDISLYLLNNEEVNIVCTNEQYTTGSAQAFMQGLYPPLMNTLNHTNILGISGLANGTNMVAPLNGYQYPSIQSLSSYDLDHIWIDGAANCPAFTGELVQYYNTSDFNFLYQSTLDFYHGLEDNFLQGTFSPNSLGYFDAYYIYDYLQYEYLHNSTVANTLSLVNMTRAEILAADWIQAMFGNATNQIRSIAGRALATQILNTFYNTIRTEGATNKLNLWFGDLAPMVSFAALAGLTTPQNAIFYSIPPMGSSFVFELISLSSTQASNLDFPSTSDMYVRFYFTNGTQPSSDLVSYPLFGRSPSQTLISYAEFVNGLSKFSLSGVKQWCDTCSSYSVFCPAYTGVNPGSSTSNQKHKLSPVIAGVIGALVSLAVAGLLFGLLMLVVGLRFHRQPSKGRSDLGGFKGSRKLASDQDLTLPKGAAGATTTEVEPELTKGHERTGSWEMRNQAKSLEAGEAPHNATHERRPSFEDDEINIDDPYAQAVKPHDHV